MRFSSMYKFEVETLPAGDLGIHLSSRALFVIAIAFFVVSTLLSTAAASTEKRIRK